MSDTQADRVERQRRALNSKIVDYLMAQRNALYAELKAVEWSSRDFDPVEQEDVWRCPKCRGFEDKGHRANCTLNAALNEANPERTKA